MLAILRVVPVWVWIVAAALGYGWMQRHKAQAAHAEQARRDAATHQLRERAMHDALIEVTRRAAAQQEVVDASQEQARVARADADRVRVALDGLRRRAAARAAAGPAPADPAASAVSPAAPAAADLCTDVLQRLGQAAGQLAEESDRRGNAGATCVGLYDALTPTQQVKP